MQQSHLLPTYTARRVKYRGHKIISESTFYCHPKVVSPATILTLYGHL